MYDYYSHFGTIILNVYCNNALNSDLLAAPVSLIKPMYPETDNKSTMISFRINIIAKNPIVRAEEIAITGLRMLSYER